MSKETFQNIPHTEVRTVSLTESHHGDRPAKRDRLLFAHTNGPVLIIGISKEEPEGQHPIDEMDQPHPFGGIDFNQINQLQVLNQNHEEITEPQYLLGVDPWEGDGHLHIFTDGEFSV